MLDIVLIENANTLIQWQKRAYLAEARVKELEEAAENGDELLRLDRTQVVEAERGAHQQAEAEEGAG